MKNKLVLYVLHVFFLFNICAYAQDITPGYYRVKNVGLLSYGGTVKGKTVIDDCYAYVANGTYKMATGSGAKQNIQSLQLWTGLDNAIISPQTVIYIAKTGSNYNLEAQGTSLSQMTSYTIIVSQVPGTTDTYTLSTTVSGVAASLWVDKTKTGRYNMQGDVAYPTNYQSTTTSQDGGDTYRQWQIVPISTSSDNYVAVNASLKVKDEEDETKYKYYAPYYASYPFRLVSPGMKAYYVSSITDKKYTLQEITSEVIPGATPVIIACPSNNPTDCKIEPLRGDFGSVNGNKLKGAYFCNLSMSPKENDYPDCRTEFKAESMRVWAVKYDKLILTNNPDKTRAVPLALSGFSGIWIRPNESYLPDVPSTAAAELVSAGKATTISFDSDGGTTVEDISGGEGDPVTAPANPTKTGYSFTGWNPALPDVFPAEDMTVKAQWQINKYTITFNTNGGTPIDPITQVYQSAIQKPADPTKTGYTFAGWDATIPDLMPAENLTINARWTTNPYAITFDTDGGTTIDPIRQDYGTTVVAPANPTKTGYTFVGWDKDIPSTMPAENIVVKALWKINQYTITFNTDGGTAVEPITQDYNTAITKPSDPTKEGSIFAGWDKEIPALMPAENVTVKALWNKLYTITFDTDGGSEVKAVTAVSGTAISAPEDPTKTGYTFAGWNPALPETMPASDVTCKAQWTVNKYKVTFKNYDGSILYEATLDYGTAIPVPASDPVKPGAVFKEWSPTPAATVPAEDVVYTASFDDSEYTITFDTDGGSPVPNDIKDYYNKDITDRTKDIQNPTKEGYAFKGWEPAIPSVITGDLTIKAIWEKNKYTITFDTDGGSVVEPVQLEWESTITAPSEPKKTGYSFIGWDPALPNTMPMKDISTKAKWQINKHSIIYFVDGKEYKKIEDVEYNTSITPETEPAKEGYTFSGWSAIPSTMPDNDVNITGTFSVNQYTITFDTDGGTEVAPVTQNYNTSIAKPNNPMKEGYTFTGWDKDIPSTMPAENMTIKALWQINEYSLNYFVDGVLYKSEKVTYNSDVTAEAEPTKVGYTFSGWKEEIPSVMPANDVTITGIFTINEHTITFDSNGGTEVASITQNYGTEIKVNAPTKDGYDFVDWTPALPETMPDEDLNLKAIWGPKTWKETYDFKEGWTWVSFAMFNDEMSDLGTVLSSLKWTSTDEIKGANVWGIYSAKKNKWVGYLAGFNEVTMYKIHSSVDQQLTLDGSYQNSKGNMSLSVEKGWNYLAYLSLKDLPVREALQNYAASEGDILKSQTQSATYSNGKWIGDLQMEPRKGYMLYRAADNKVSFTYPIALEEEKSNSSRAMRFESKAQRFSSNMNVFATVEGVMAVPGDSIVAVAIDGVRGGAAIDNEGKASLTILGDNNADIYLALMHNNIIVASAKAPISYASDNIVGSYANPTAIEFVEGSEAWSGDYNVTAVYTMDGKQLPTTDIKTLTTGLYIIKYETLSDNNSNTGGCRVIRVVR